MKVMYKSLFILLLTLPCLLPDLNAQGWEYQYLVGLNFNQANDLTTSDDGGYLLAGTSTDFGPVSGSEVLLIKLDIDGDEQWVREYAPPASFFNGANAVDRTNDGGYIVGGFSEDVSTMVDRNLYFIRVDDQGDTLWTKTIQNSGPDEVTDVKATADGGCIASAAWAVPNQNGGTFTAGSILKLDADGNVEWQQIYSFDNLILSLKAVALTDDGGYIAAGSQIGINFLMKTNSLGDTTWTRLVPGGEGDGLEDVIQTSDGGYAVCGFIGGFAGPSPIAAKVDATGELENFVFASAQVPIGTASEIKEISGGGFIVSGFPFNQFSSGFITRLNNNVSQIVWSELMNTTLSPPAAGYAVVLASDGGFVVAGEGDEGSYAVKTDGSGVTYSVSLQGNVYHDPDLVCATDDAPFTGLTNWTVEAVGNAGTFYGYTDENGDYEITTDTGTYTITAYPPTDAWSVCEGPFTINAPQTFDTILVNFQAEADYFCPNMTVSLSAPFLRRCDDNVYYVTACNGGTLVATEASLIVTLDPFMTYNSSSIPISGQVNNVLTFDIGDVEPGACEFFNINVFLDCSAELGQTHCTEAYVTPDTICNLDPAWDMSSVMVDAACEGDSIRFFIRNIGTGNMTAAQQYLVIEDQIILYSDMFMLDSEEEISFAVPANGSTYRLEAEQSMFHPGFSMPSVTVEGCVEVFGMPFNTGFVIQLPEDDGDGFVDIDCQENIGAFDPNDKRGFPEGFGPEHFITDDTELEYHIRFQNTGTDTAFLVVIRDEISEHLDISTFRAGTSSHPYTVEFNGRVAKFTFDNIMLPDSNVNEPASHGFVRFTIKQEPDNPNGTIINNTADIYFDFNAPITTNTTYHRIGEDFIDIVLVNVEEVLDETISLEVAPNPFSDLAVLQIEGLTQNEIDLRIIDINGRVVRERLRITNDRIIIEKGNLQAGVYFIQISSDNRLIANGKIVVF